MGFLIILKLEAWRLSDLIRGMTGAPGVTQHVRGGSHRWPCLDSYPFKDFNVRAPFEFQRAWAGLKHAQA